MWGVYLCTCTYMHVHIHKSKYLQANTYKHTHIMSSPIYIYTCTRTHIHTHAQVHKHPHIHTYILPPPPQCIQENTWLAKNLSCTHKHTQPAKNKLKNASEKSSVKERVLCASLCVQNSISLRSAIHATPVSSLIFTSSKYFFFFFFCLKYH